MKRNIITLSTTLLIMPILSGLSFDLGYSVTGYGLFVSWLLGLGYLMILYLDGPNNESIHRRQRQEHPAIVDLSDIRKDMDRRKAEVLKYDFSENANK